MKTKSSSSESGKKNKFILFVSGMSVKSLRAHENIKKIGADYYKGKFELLIIDIGAHPELAEKYQIIALPTLIRTSPSPRRILVGDLSQTKKVLRILDIIQ